ncbi:hypothetical protein [Streptomyces sp. NPDC051561]|uniref:hypothetical protein n=1 Tax=Streptomyces sp. NPDC051561 TaxID=3365658 RepID=UPI0037AB7185
MTGMTGMAEGLGGGRAGLGELLRCAGLELVGEQRRENVLPPRVAWRPMVAGSTEPTVAVSEDRADQVDELNAQWYRLAVEHGILDERGEGDFLIHVPGNGGEPGAGEWTRVRLASEEWDLAGVLGERAGRPEFVTLSLDGEVLLGATAEEYETWLILVEGISARQQAAAEAAVRESPGERGAARFHFWRPLPTAVVEAGLTHPSRKVRHPLVEVQPNITVEQWERILLDESATAQDRWLCSSIAADRGVALTEATYARLCSDPDSEVRAEAARLHGVPARLLETLCSDPEASVRAEACGRGWPRLAEPVRRKLLTDTAAGPRIQALLMHHREHPLSRAVFDGQELGTVAAETCRLEHDLAAHLAVHEDPSMRRALARNPHLLPALVGMLSADADAQVRAEAAVSPVFTEERRATIPLELDPRIQRRALGWVTALHGDFAAVRRLARSPQPAIRRSVARAQHLTGRTVQPGPRRGGASPGCGGPTAHGCRGGTAARRPG